MDKSLKILAIILSVILITLCTSYLYFFKTNSGKSFIVSKTVATIKQSTGLDIEVDTSKGSWPNKIALHDIKIKDPEGIWFEADEVILAWSPLSLISRHINVDELSTVNLIYHRAPILKKSSQEKYPSQSTSLPNIKATLKKIDFEARIINDRLTDGFLQATLKGNVSYEQGRLETNLNGQANTGTNLHIRAKINHAQDRLIIDAQFDDPVNGLIPQISQTPTQTSYKFTLKEDSTLSNFKGDINIIAGDFGTMSGIVSCVCLDLPDLSSKLFLEPGPAIAPNLRAQIGKVATVSVKTNPSSFEKFNIEIDTHRASMITDITYTDENRITVNGTLTPALIDENIILLKAGNEIQFSGQAYLADALTIPLANIKTDHLTFTASDFLIINGLPKAGHLSLSGTLAPWFSEKTQATNHDINVNLVTTSQGYAITTHMNGTYADKGLNFNANALFDMRKSSFETQLKAFILPEIAARLSPDLTLEQTAQLTLIANGDAATQNIDLTSSLPSLTFQGEKITELHIQTIAARNNETIIASLDMSGIEAAKSKPFIAKLKAHIEKTGLINLSNINVDIPGLIAKGDLYILPDGSFPKGKFTAISRDLSEVLFIPQNITGDINAFLNVPENDETAQAMVSITSAALNLPNISVKNASVKLNGIAQGVVWDASVERLVSGSNIISKFNADGHYSHDPASHILSLKNLQTNIDAHHISLKTPARILYNGQKITTEEMQITINETGTFIVEGFVEPAKAMADFTLMAKSIPLTEQNLLVSAEVTSTLNKELDKATFKVNLENIEHQEKSASLALQGNWRDNAVNLNGILNHTDKILPFLKLEAPLSRPDKNAFAMLMGEVVGTIKYEGAIEDWTELIPLDHQFVSGNVDINLAFSGMADTPSLKGNIKLADGAYAHDIQGISLNEVKADLKIDATPQSGNINLILTANDGTTRTDDAITTNLKVNYEGVDVWNVDGDILLNKARLVTQQDIKAEASSLIKISGTQEKVSVTGDITLEEVNLSIPDHSISSVPELNIVRIDLPKRETAQKDVPSSLPIFLDLKIKAEDNVFVRGRGLESEWESNLTVTGTAQNPKIDGKLSTTEGNITLSGRRFIIDEGEVLFDRNAGTAPFLNIITTYKVSNAIDAHIIIEGKATAPEISLSSIPILPQDDVMAYILFGTTVNELSAAQTLQVAQTIATLSGGGSGFNVADKASDALGVDSISIDAIGDNPNISVGKTIAEGVYVTAGQSLDGGGGNVSVEIELTDDISVETEVDQINGQSISLNWEKDY